MIVTRFTDATGEANLTVEAFAGSINELSNLVYSVIAPEFEKYGIELTKFLIENVSMPDEVKKEIFELRNKLLNISHRTKICPARLLRNQAGRIKDL